MLAAAQRIWCWQRLRHAGVAVLLALLPAVASAVVDISPIADIDFGSWSVVQGDVAAGVDFCVVSTAGSSGNPRVYAVTGSPAVGGSYAVVGPGGAAIPFTLTFTDLTDSSAEQLQPFVRSNREMTGVADCTGLQTARLTVAFNAVDLAAAQSGSYELRVDFFGQNNNGNSDSESFLVRLRISGQMRISDLDPIDLGAFDGTNDLSGTDDLCVYRNSGGSAYTVSADGNGAGGAFTVSNGGSTLPYAVDYDDGGGFVGMAVGVPAAMTGADTSATDCGGATNARVRITISGADMAAAPAGVYSGTLMLLVAPQ